MSTSVATCERCLVFAGGQFPDKGLSNFDFRDTDAIVSVDRGLEHVLRLGLQPQLLLGDFDSIDADMLAAVDRDLVECVAYPTDKDASDLQLALEMLAERASACAEVVLLGVSGGRTDHLLFNWLLPSLREWPFRLLLLDNTVCAWWIDARFPLHLQLTPGQTVSLLSPKGAAGISTRGLAYELQSATLLPGSTLGLSNEVTEPAVEVSVDSGRLMVLVCHDATVSRGPVRARQP